MWQNISEDQSHIVREDEVVEPAAVSCYSSSGFFGPFLQRLRNWLSFFWQGIIRMLTARPMMMMLSSSSVVDRHALSAAASTLDKLEEDFQSQQDKTRFYSSCQEISAAGGREVSSRSNAGLIGTSFPPLHFGHARCGFQESRGHLLQNNIDDHKHHHSESDLTEIRIMSERHHEEEESISKSLEEECQEYLEEEPLFAMDEDRDDQEEEAAFTLDNCLITDSDVSKFLSGLQEEKTFNDKRGECDEEEFDNSSSSSSSSSTSSPISVKSNKFECSLSTIEASPVVSSCLTDFHPTINVLLSEEEELTPLQKKIINSHPPTKPSNQPEKKFLEVKDNKGRKLRRASSLKIYTSSEEKSDTQKKIVRFADVLGLDLESTKTYNHGIPTVPKSAYIYLRDVELSDTESEASSRGIGGYSSSRPTRSITPPSGFTRSPEQIVAKSGLAPQFTQPGAKTDFDSVVNSLNLSLECAYVSVNGSTLSGIVAVKNISFHKEVTIRYTLDDWHSHTDAQASYSSSCSQSGFDKFSFDILFPSPVSLSQRLQFCIRYSTMHGEFWDNNFGGNYIFKSLNKFDKMSSSVSHQSRIKRPAFLSQSPSCSEDPWLHFV